MYQFPVFLLTFHPTIPPLIQQSFEQSEGAREESPIRLLLIADTHLNKKISSCITNLFVVYLILI
jgi:hypothetical protein